MPRILLVYHNPLFAHSIHVALDNHPEITLVGEREDWTHATEDLVRLAPDIVILEDDGSETTDRALHELSQRQTPWRVVALRLDETTMRIWSGAGQPITRTQDLIDALMQSPI